MPFADTDRRALFGAALVIAFAFVVVVTMMFLVPVGGIREQVFAIQVGAVAVAWASLRAVSGSDPPAVHLLVFPCIVLADLVAIGSVSRPVSTAYVGFVSLVFVYAGLTQRRGVPALMALVATPVWLYCLSPITRVQAVRLPIALALWLIIGEALAARTSNDRRLTGRLVLEAQTDVLTGLANRRSLEAGLAQLQPGDAVALVDLDNFKNVNDRLGHDAGDQVLAEFGRVLHQVCRDVDVTLRYGGDEFLVLLRGAGRRGSEAFLMRLHDGWHLFSETTYSAGVAVYEGGPPSVTLRRADESLYVAKAQGRDRAVTWAPVADEAPAPRPVRSPDPQAAPGPIDPLR